MEQESSSGQSQTAKNELWEWIKALLIAAALVVIIRYFIFAPFMVDGPSMQPNFQTGERLIVDKILYKFRKPDRGEVIVFHAPEGRDYIKRVIALPGETVRVEGDDVYINGKKLDEPYIQDKVNEYQQKGETYNNLNYDEQTVPEGTIFVMGDNRRNSQDSRSIGFIGFDKVVGRSDLIYWPVNKIEIVKH